MSSNRTLTLGVAATRATSARPLAKPMAAHLSAQLAWARLVREGLRFLVIAEPVSGRLLGVVDRESLRPRRCCCARPSGECSVVNHRVEDAGFCFADEDLDAVLQSEAERLQEYPYPRSRSVPLIVVDRSLRPVGYLGESVGRAATAA
jgi:hypothetical protein